MTDEHVLFISKSFTQLASAAGVRHNACREAALAVAAAAEHQRGHMKLTELLVAGLSMTLETRRPELVSLGLDALLKLLASGFWQRGDEDPSRTIDAFYSADELLRLTTASTEYVMKRSDERGIELQNICITQLMAVQHQLHLRGDGTCILLQRCLDHATWGSHELVRDAALRAGEQVVDAVATRAVAGQGYVDVALDAAFLLRTAAPFPHLERTLASAAGLAQKCLRAGPCASCFDAAGCSLGGGPEAAHSGDARLAHSLLKDAFLAFICLAKAAGSPTATQVEGSRQQSDRARSAALRLLLRLLRSAAADALFGSPLFAHPARTYLTAAIRANAAACDGPTFSAVGGLFAELLRRFRCDAGGEMEARP